MTRPEILDAARSCVFSMTVLLEGTSYAFYKNGQAVCADCFDELMKSFSDASRAIENGIRCGNLPEV